MKNSNLTIGLVTRLVAASYAVEIPFWNVLF
jgi:hypothetical protein